MKPLEEVGAARKRISRRGRRLAWLALAAVALLLVSCAPDLTPTPVFSGTLSPTPLSTTAAPTATVPLATVPPATQTLAPTQTALPAATATTAPTAAPPTAAAPTTAPPATRTPPPTAAATSTPPATATTAATAAATIAPTSETPLSMTVTRAAFRLEAEKAGFAFEAASTTNGQPSQRGTRAGGGCSSVITLLGPEQAVRRAELQMTGCSPTEMIGQATALVTPITAQWDSDADVDALITWATVDIMPLLQGGAGASTKVIGGVTFSANSVAGPPHQLTLAVDLTKPR